MQEEDLAANGWDCGAHAAHVHVRFFSVTTRVGTVNYNIPVLGSNTLAS
jgi:hypothetical protein